MNASKSLLMFAVAPIVLAATPDPATLSTPTLTFAFAELVTLAPAVTPGDTAYGGRNIIPITGGTFEGPGIKGTIMPGGWDWQLRRADGCLDIKADYFLKTDDGVVINVLNKGVVCPPPPGRPFSGRTLPVFEVPRGKYEWLGKTNFVGTLESGTAPDGGAAVAIRFYKIG